jgi:hypothetical protein
VGVLTALATMWAQDHTDEANCLADAVRF